MYCIPVHLMFPPPPSRIPPPPPQENETLTTPLREFDAAIGVSGTSSKAKTRTGAHATVTDDSEAKSEMTATMPGTAESSLIASSRRGGGGGGGGGQRPGQISVRSANFRWTEGGTGQVDAHAKIFAKLVAPKDKSNDKNKDKNKVYPKKSRNQRQQEQQQQPQLPRQQPQEEGTGNGSRRDAAEGSDNSGSGRGVGSGSEGHDGIVVVGAITVDMGERVQGRNVGDDENTAGEVVYVYEHRSPGMTGASFSIVTVNATEFPTPARGSHIIP